MTAIVPRRRCTCCSKKSRICCTIHLADLDSEEHDNAPYTREAKAIVERSDELIGQILSVLPAESALAVVAVAKSP
jgi:hypothetical protein